jgi:glycosyltransferase involved in cell wall biosynthesis
LYYSISWPLKIIKRPVDVFIGAGNINVFAGLLLKLINKAKKTVYYVIDYASVRFSNKTLNFLYHLLDAICARFSSGTWNYSSVMIKERSAKWHYAFPNQTVVPNGIRIRNDIIVPLEKCNKHEIIYMGTLAGFQGVDTAIRALSGIRAVYADATFTVIGDGKDIIALKTLVQKLKLTKAVTFLGFIEDPREMESRIAKASIGVACYDTNHPLVFTTEPGKVKRYLSCGIPVVMTDVSPIAKDIGNYSCGFIVSGDYKELMSTVINYFRNEKQMKTYRLHAFAYTKQFQWKVLFQKAFESLEK